MPNLKQRKTRIKSIIFALGGLLFCFAILVGKLYIDNNDIQQQKTKPTNKALINSQQNPHTKTETPQDSDTNNNTGEEPKSDSDTPEKNSTKPTSKLLIGSQYIHSYTNNSTGEKPNIDSNRLLINSHPGISPYIKAGILQDFGANNKRGITLDAFIPITGNDTNLFFSNLKLDRYSNETFDGGVYLGYRHLLPEDQKLYGVYTALNFKKTENGNYFNQVTLGLECWIKQWFLGYKIFSPVGKSKKAYGDPNIEVSYERALAGTGAQIGYEFSKKTSVHLEGYYLRSLDTSNIPGIRVKLKQNLFSKKTNAGILDQVNLEVEVQKDKLTGNRVSLELNFKLGGFSNSTPNDVAAHMTDTISKTRVFIEKKSRKLQLINCFYWKNNGTLDAYGSSELCPATYNSAISNNPGMTLIDETQDWQFRGVTLRV
jgi:hypothetical protein